MLLPAARSMVCGGCARFVGTPPKLLKGRDHLATMAKSEMESVAGAAPFAAGMETWLRNAPGFLLDRVQTPIQLQANAPASLFEQWEWFSGLQRLNKPVDLFYLPAGTHIRPVKGCSPKSKAWIGFVFGSKGKKIPIPPRPANTLAGTSCANFKNRMTRDS